MLHRIIAKGVGPISPLELDLAPRANIITGDNGVGKSFILDLVWLVLTRTFANEPIQPTGQASLEFTMDLAKGGPKKFSSSWDRGRQEWKRSQGRPPTPGLVLYARVDGGFSVWDPRRNYWRDAPTLGVNDANRPDAFHLDRDQVWKGLEANGQLICNGLIVDWVTWQLRAAAATLAVKDDEQAEFSQLSAALEALSPNEQESIVPGKPTRVAGSAREIPTIVMPYGATVPITIASAGMRRIAALAYLLVWAWNEHRIASIQRGLVPEHRVIFLIDEIEAHLHPKWQRVILQALINVVQKLHREADVQLVVTTHSPLVMVGIEPTFDAARDRWFDLDVDSNTSKPEVTLTPRAFSRRGTAGRWLSSPAFDLSSEGRSPQAEQAIAEADALRSRDAPAPTREEIEKVDATLRGALSELDTYLSRWSDWRDERLEGEP
jgi:hypothetical protein